MVGFLKIFGYKDPHRPLGWNIHTKPQQLISSLLNVGTIAGVLLTGPFAHYFGRKAGVWVASGVSFIALGLQLGATTLPQLYAGRALVGFANGFYITFANTYTSEIAPAHLRGVLVALFGFWVNTGSLAGAIADNFSKDRLDKTCYQIPLGVLYLVPFFLSVMIFFIPESPRWLLIHDRKDEARLSLVKVRGHSLEPKYLEEETFYNTPSKKT